jgi:NMT1/THI5 like
MRMRKHIRLGFCSERARWRAANAQFRLIVLAVIFLAATAVAARAADQVTTTYQSVTIGSSTPLWIAKDAGFFERQGLDVKIVFVEGSPRTMQTLIAGEAQIVESTGPATLNARAAGSPVVIVAGYINVMPYWIATCRSARSATRRCVCRRCRRASLILWSRRISSFSRPSA